MKTYAKLIADYKATASHPSHITPQVEAMFRCLCEIIDERDRQEEVRYHRFEKLFRNLKAKVLRFTTKGVSE